MLERGYDAGGGERPALDRDLRCRIEAHRALGVGDIEIAHVDPAMVTYVKELQERFPYDPSARTGIPNVLRTGESEFGF